MVIILKPGANNTQIEKICNVIKQYGSETHIVNGEICSIIGVIGDITKIDIGAIEFLDGVDRVVRIQEPFKQANRKFHPDDSIIKIGDRDIGSNKIALIAGPCSVESEEQILDIAKSVKESGASFLRGGAFKPRTSPYAFQGMGLDGLKLLKLAKKETGLPIVSELTSTEYLDFFIENVDVIQVGARNMQNYELLKALGKTNKPILLKRGLCATIEELLMSAEYILSRGNENIILCERGIRTYENYTRNTLDISAIPMIKKLSHLPVIVDPSHASGIWWMVESLSKAAIAVGADGLIIEVHNDPLHALSDGNQSITPDRFSKLVEKLRLIAKIEGREI